MGSVWPQLGSRATEGLWGLIAVVALDDTASVLCLAMKGG